MRRQPVVDMLSDLMIPLPGLMDGIDMDRDIREIAHLMEELMADLNGKRMPLCDREGR